MARFQLERIGTLWFVTLGLTSLAAGILVYILLLESALGAFSIRETSPARLFDSQRNPRVAILNSAYTIRAYQTLNPLDGRAAERVEASVESWRNFIMDPNLEIRHREISDADLEEGNLIDNYDVLILPSSIALSNLQINQIKDFMGEGGNVLATWTPGLYDQNGNWRGWSFIEDIFGVGFEGFVDRGAGNYRIYTDTFPGITPAGVYIPDGLLNDITDLELSNRDREMRQEAEAMDYAPLRGYTWWSDTTNYRFPRHDFAVARPYTGPLRDLDGQVRQQQAVVLSYYTWIGGDTRNQIPYPRTGSGVRRFTLRGNSPLTANIPSGYRAKIQIYNPGVKVRVLEDRARAAGFWYDFAVDRDQLVASSLENSTGAVYGTYLQGRFVYMGFQRDAVSVYQPESITNIQRRDQEDYEQVGRFFVNVMDYLRGTPTSWVREWPHQAVAGSFRQHEGGAVIAGVADEGPIANFNNAAEELRRAGFRGTYFVRPEGINSSDAGLLRNLHQAGDVGVLDDLKDNGDGTEQEQEARLRSLKATLEGVVGSEVTGYRSSKLGNYGIVRTNPDGSGRLISFTMHGLSEAGYRYFLPDSVGRRMMPKIMGSPYETLTRIGYTARHDSEVQERMAALDGNGDVAAAFYLEDIERVAYENSMYRLVYSTNGLARSQGVLGTIAQDLRARNFWVVPGDEMAAWWRIHRGLNSDVEQRGPARLFVRVSNDNGHLAENVTLSIALPKRIPLGGGVIIRPELVNVGDVITGDEAQEVNWQLSDDRSILNIAIEELRPQQYRIFHIDLLEDQSERSPLLADD